MVKLLALKVSIAVWKQTLSISGKFKPRTWVFLAILNACIAVISFWGYQATSVSESAIPPVYHAELKPMPLPSRLTDDSSCVFYAWHSLGTISKGQSIKFRSTLNVNLHISRARHSRLVALSDTSQAFVIKRSGYVMFSAYGYNWENNPFGWRIPHLPDLGGSSVVYATSDLPHLLGRVERIVALLACIVTAFLSILNTFFAWQTYRRAKMDAVLRDLQIREIQARLNQMERERLREIEEARKSRIILIS